MDIETVTVDEAIKKGRRQLFFLPLILMFLISGAMISLACFSKSDSIWMAVLGVSGFLAGPLVCMLYIFTMLPRWQIWAFSNVRNLHELKQRAILAQFYPKDSSFLWRLMIRNADRKEQLAALQQKFDRPDIFTDNHALPFETNYAYGNVLTFFYVLFTLAFLSAAIYYFVDAVYLVAFISLVGVGMFGWQTYKRLLDRGPIITISNDGIATKENGFHPWGEIQNERITFTQAGRSSYYALEYEASGTKVKINLRELTGLSSDKIDPVLRTYRGRYESSRKRE